MPVTNADKVWVIPVAVILLSGALDLSGVDGASIPCTLLAFATSAAWSRTALFRLVGRRDFYVGVDGGDWKAGVRLEFTVVKGGVRLMTKSIALECARQGIRCNTVHPGVIWTAMQEVAIRDNPATADILNAAIPVGRMGTPDEVADAILFLASDEARYITGAELVVDGGLTAQ